MRSCRKLLKSKGHGPDDLGPEMRNPAAGGTASGADAEVQTARQLSESDIKKTKRDATRTQVFLNSAVYDGRTRLGSIRQIAEHEFCAVSLDGTELGTFRSLRAASAAIAGSTGGPL